MNKKAAEQQRAVRSMETPEQYSEFEDSVIEAAKTQAQRIIDDARRQGDANFDKLMEGHRGDPLIPYREEAKNRLARKMASVKQDNRKKLLVYRSQLVNGLFAEMEEALEEYTGTPAYAQRVADALARRAPGNFRQMHGAPAPCRRGAAGPRGEKGPALGGYRRGRFHPSGRRQAGNTAYPVRRNAGFRRRSRARRLFDALQAAGGVTRAAPIRARRRANEYGPLPEKPFFQAFFPDGLELGASL